jgi:hypothetical protein
MDKTNQVVFNEPRFSTNMKNLSLKKKEKMVAWILAMKFHTKSTEEIEIDKEVRLNPIMKDLIIKRYTDEHHTQAVKRKQIKLQKTEVRAKVVERIGENQPYWLDTLKEEIVNLK